MVRRRWMLMTFERMLMTMRRIRQRRRRSRGMRAIIEMHSSYDNSETVMHP